MQPCESTTEVFYVTDDDARNAMQNALNRAGLTLEELKEQGRNHRFESEDARLAWWLIDSPMNPDREELGVGYEAA
jgi:hypothetical protein